MDNQDSNNSKGSKDTDIKEKLSGYKTQISSLMDDLRKGTSSSPQAILSDISSIKNMAESLASNSNDPAIAQLISQIDKIAANAVEAEQQIKAKNRSLARAENVGLATENKPEQISVIPITSAEVREAFKDVAKIEAMAEELAKKTGKSNIYDGALGEELRAAKAEEERLAHAKESEKSFNQMLDKIVDPQEKTAVVKAREDKQEERKELKQSNAALQEEDLGIMGMFDETPSPKAAKQPQSAPSTKDMREDLAKNTDTRMSVNQLGNLTPSDTPGQGTSKPQEKGV